MVFTEGQWLGCCRVAIFKLTISWVLRRHTIIFDRGYSRPVKYLDIWLDDSLCFWGEYQEHKGENRDNPGGYIGADAKCTGVSMY